MIGAFGYLSIWLDTWLYVVYVLIIITIILGYLIFVLFTKKDRIRREISVFIFSSAVITVGLSIIQSFFRDFQAQGRYIITVMFAIAYMAACTLERFSSKKGAVVLTFIWIVLAIFVFTVYMTRMFY